MIVNMLINLMNTVGSKMTDLLVLVLIAAAVLLFIRYQVILLQPIHNRLKTINRVESKGTDQKSFLSMVMSIENGRLSSSFKEFRQRMDTVQPVDPVLVIEDCFNEEDILWIPAGRRRAETVPAVIVAMGIMGALLLMVARFATIGGGPGGSAAGTGTAAAAFETITSIGLEASAVILSGFIISFIYLLADRLFYLKSVQELKRLRDKLVEAANGGEGAFLKGKGGDGQNTTLERVEKLLQDYLISMQDAGKSSVDRIIEAIGSLSSEIKRAGQLEMNTLVEIFIKQLHSTLPEYYKKLESSMQGLILAQEKALKTMDGIYAGFGEALSNQAAVNQSTSGIMEKLSKYSMELSNGNQAVNASLDKIKEVTEALVAMPEAIGEMSSRLEEQQRLFSEENNAFLERLGTGNDSMQERMNIALENIFTRFYDVTTEVIKKYDDNTGMTIDKLSGTVETMMSSMDEKVYAVNLYANQLSVDVKGLVDALEGAVGTFQTELHGSVEKTFRQFDIGLASIAESLSTTVDAMKETVEELPAVVVRLGKISGEDAPNNKKGK